MASRASSGRKSGGPPGKSDNIRPLQRFNEIWTPVGSYRNDVFHKPIRTVQSRSPVPLWMKLQLFAWKLTNAALALESDDSVLLMKLTCHDLPSQSRLNVMSRNSLRRPSLHEYGALDGSSGGSFRSDESVQLRHDEVEGREISVVGLLLEVEPPELKVMMGRKQALNAKIAVPTFGSASFVCCRWSEGSSSQRTSAQLDKHATPIDCMIRKYSEISALLLL